MFLYYILSINILLANNNEYYYNDKYISKYGDFTFDDENNSYYPNERIDVRQLELKLYRVFVNRFRSYEGMFAVDRSESKFAIILIPKEDSLLLQNENYEVLEDDKFYDLILNEINYEDSIACPFRVSIPLEAEYMIYPTALSYNNKKVKLFSIKSSDTKFYKFYIQVFTSPNLVVKNKVFYYKKTKNTKPK
jgi:hypothetical protein